MDSLLQFQWNHQYQAALILWIKIPCAHVKITKHQLAQPVGYWHYCVECKILTGIDISSRLHCF